MRTFRIVLSFGVILAAAGGARADWRVWTVTDTRRVLRDDPAGNGAEARLAAARNQTRGFQILVRADEAVKGVRIEPGDLRGPEGAVLRAAGAQIFRQHQFELTTGTYRNADFQPGWYPDALIPARHPVTHEPLQGAKYVAMPFDLPANQTHGFWVDLLVPADAAPGQYHGTYRVTADGGKTADVAVVLTVWNFALPATPTLRTAFGSPAGSVRRYAARRAKEAGEPPPADWAAVETQIAALLAEHRINATPPGPFAPAAQPDGSFRIPDEQVAALREFVDRYHVNAIQTLHPSTAVKDPEAERQRFRAWLAAFDRAAAELDRPQVLFFTYLKDEPNDEEAYQYVRKWGRAVREAKSAVKVLVVEQPQTQDPKWGDLYGAVDVWCPLFSLFEPEPAANRQALGEMVWTYTALCQGKPTPWWHTDYPLLNYRVPAWIAWRYRMQGLLYWGGLSHWTQVDDPWTDPRTYRPKDSPKLVFNGEGSIVYPARPVGYDGIAASLRLKALRDAIDDYEYLSILQRRGQATEAEKVVLPLAGSWFQWDRDPAAYDAARAKLAEMILRGK